KSNATPLHTHSFPTRRSSDLVEQRLADKVAVNCDRVEHSVNGCKHMRFRDQGRMNSHFDLRFFVGLNDREQLDPVPEFICKPNRSEEHTSELQSRFDLVCRLL